MPLISTFGHVGASIIPIHWGIFTSFCIVVFSAAPALCTLYGVVEMMRIRSHGWAVAAAIISMTSCNIVGFAAGIWALIVLLQPRVRETFASPRASQAPETWPWILGVVAVVCLLFVLMMSCFALLFSQPHAEPLSARVVQMQQTQSTPSAIPSNMAKPAPSIQNLQQALKIDTLRLQGLTNLANHMILAQRGSSNDLPEIQMQIDDLQELVKLQEQASRNLIHPVHKANAGTELDELGKKLDLSSDSLFRLSDEIEENIEKTHSAVVAEEQKKMLQSQLSVEQLALTNIEQGYKSGMVPSNVVEMAKDNVKVLQAEYQKACSELTNAQEQLRQAEAAIQQTNGQITVAGNTATFTESANGTAPLTYQWYKNGTNSSAGMTNGTLILNTIPVPAIIPAELHNQTIDIGGSTDFSQSFTVEPGGQLTMDVDRGDAQITGGDQSTVEIQVTREVTHGNGADASAILKGEHVTLQQTGNTISITAQEPEMLRSRSLWGLVSQPNLNAHYEITLPRTFTVRSKTSGGDIKVAGVQSSVTITTMGGRLDCQDIDGTLDGKTMGGDVQAAGCKGKVHLETMGGGITIDGFSGPNIQATTQGGSVSADFAAAPTADCELSTSGGNVTARLPADAAVTLDAHTEGGSVSSDFSVPAGHGFINESLQGPINGGGPKLKMQTMGGNIEVLKR